MNTTLARISGLCLVGVALTVGCSGGPSTSGGLTIDEFFSQAALVECKQMLACCDAAELSQRAKELEIPIPTTVNECTRSLAARSQKPLDDYLREAIAAGRVAFDGAAAARCIEGAEPENCASKLESAPDCANLWTGAVPLGGACASRAECKTAETSCVFKSDDAELGQCMPNSEEGEACDFNRRCATGLVCTSDGEASTCVKLAANGEACAARFDCESYYCDPTGLCAPLRVAGEACLAEEDCYLSYCDTGTMKCAPRKGPGETCSMEGMCSSGPCEMTTHTCPPAPAEVCDGA